MDGESVDDDSVVVTRENNGWSIQILDIVRNGL